MQSTLHQTALPNARTIQFDIKGDTRGSLIVLEHGANVPFPVARAYYIFGTADGVRRGFHAHADLEQIAVCVRGHCKFFLDDGTHTEEVTLDRPDLGLYLGPMIWREMFDFSEDCVLLVLASKMYDPADYIRDRAEFNALAKAIGRPAILRKPEIIGRSINLRDAEVRDAAFILALRSNERLSKHLSKTNSDLAAQEAWLEAYQQGAGQAYFIIEDKAGKPLGTVRLYDRQGDSFCWGSWILREGSPQNAAVESALLVYEYAFGELGFAQAHFDVRQANAQVWKFHERFGARLQSETELDRFYVLPKANYLQVRERYAKYLPLTARATR